MKKPIAIVTGACGFIGSHMVDFLLAKGFKVRGIDNLLGGRESNLDQHKSSPDLSIEFKDIRNISHNDPVYQGADYVFHFAGIGDIVPSIEEPIDYMSTNVMGTVSALEGARHANVKKFVYAASSSCYGLATELPTTENADIDTQYPYALSKYLGEKSVFHWANCYHLNVNSIRIFNAYGPRSRTSGAYGAVFGVFLAQKLAGKPYTVVGDGLQRRDFVYVTDLVKAFYLAAQTQVNGQIFNAGAGKPQTVKRLVELLDGDIVYIPKRPGEPECTWADISKIQNELGWNPDVSFEEGVAMMLKHIDYWKDAPVWNESSINEATKDWFKFLDRAAI